MLEVDSVYSEVLATSFCSVMRALSIICTPAASVDDLQFYKIFS